MDGVRVVGFGGVQPLRDYGEQRHAFPVRDILREPPADADLAVLQAGIPSHPAARQTGSPGVAVLFLKFRLQPRWRLRKDYGRGDGTDRALARRYMAPVPQLPSGTVPPEYIHIQPAPATTTAPAAAPVPASDNAAPAPPRNPTAPIHDRVVRELGHEGDVRMPGRTRGETRAMRESPRSMGLMSHAALAQGIATREAFDEAFREHELPPPDADLPTAPASDVPTSSTVAEADSSEHAAVWRNSRTQEFRGLLQANTFGHA